MDFRNAPQTTSALHPSFCSSSPPSHPNTTELCLVVTEKSATEGKSHWLCTAAVSHSAGYIKILPMKCMRKEEALIQLPPHFFLSISSYFRSQRICVPQNQVPWTKELQDDNKVSWDNLMKYRLGWCHSGSSLSWMQCWHPTGKAGLCTNMKRKSLHVIACWVGLRTRGSCHPGPYVIMLFSRG